MTRHINLLDQDTQAPKLPWATLLSVAAPILVVATMGVLALLAQGRLDEANEDLLRAEKDLRPVQEQLSTLQREQGLKEVNAQLKARVSESEAQLTARQGISAAIQRGDLGSTEGFSSFMRAFARRPIDGVWLTGLDLDYAAHYIGIRGESLHATGPSTLIQSLRAEPILHGREIANVTVVAVDESVPATQANQSAAPAVSPRRIFRFSASSLDQRSTAPSTGANASSSNAPAGNVLRDTMQALTESKG